MFIVVVGGGKVGEYLARTLATKKNNIVLIEKDEDIALNLSKALSKVLVISGDGCDPKRLDEAKIERANVVAAVTGDDEDNLIISQLAKETYKVPRVIARVNNPKNEQTFKDLGIDAVSSTILIAKLIEEEATIGDIFTLLSLKRGKISIIEAIINESSPLIKRQIKELKLPSDSIVISIIRENKVIIPKGDTEFQLNDSVLALTTAEKEKELQKALLGKLSKSANKSK